MKRLLLLALCACGDNIAPDANLARSGTRLQLVHHVFEDGTRQTETQRFHDAARDERCTPRRWSDGLTYCTPAFSDTIFASSECTRALGRVPADGEVPPYFVRHYSLDGVWHPSRLHVPAQRADAPLHGWELREGACLGPYEVAGFDYYELGAEIDRSELVQIKHPEHRSARLVSVAYTSADGLYVPFELHDPALDTTCVLDEEAGATTARCIPSGTAEATYFHDAACAVPELAVGPTDETPAIVRARDAATDCTTFHAVGVAVDAPPLFHQNGPDCVAIAAPSSDRYYLTGALLELATLDRMRLDRSDRRLFAFDLTDGTLHRAGDSLFDSTLGTECCRELVDGVERCVPRTSVSVIALFDTDACQTTVALAEVPTASCEQPATFARAGSAIHAIGTVHAGPLFHLSTGDRCLPYLTPMGLGFHDIGPALPPGTFAAATIDVD